MKIKNLYEHVRDGKIISDIELQREIIYPNDKQVLVIDSIVNKIPLPAFYFWKNSEGILEVLDGKQRIESIKKFIENDIQYEGKLWKELDKQTQNIINDTELTIIICEGDDIKKREIFKRINTLGIPLSNYEVLNGLFHGEYLRGLTIYVTQDRDVKKIFKNNSRGKHQYNILIYLMQLKNSNKEKINEYVNKNQNKSFSSDQLEINKYIKFVASIFDNYSETSIFFNLAIKYLKDISIWKDKKDLINEKIKRYLKSDESKLTNKSTEIEDIIQAIVGGISVDDKRLFSSDDKKTFLLQQKQIKDGKYLCKICNKYFYSEELVMDHIEPWSKGGRTVLSNALLLCSPCNSKKSNKIVVNNLN